MVVIYLSNPYKGSTLSSLFAYDAGNTSGHTKKSTVNSTTLFASSVGDIVGGEIFQPKDAPSYIPGKISIIVLFSVQLVVILLLRWITQRMNKKKPACIDVIRRRCDWTGEDIQREKNKHAFTDLTDKE